MLSVIVNASVEAKKTLATLGNKLTLNFSALEPFSHARSRYDTFSSLSLRQDIKAKSFLIWGPSGEFIAQTDHF